VDQGNSAATLGKALFVGKAQCARCHVPPLFTEPGWNAHAPADVCVDSFQSDRSPDKIYRPAPLAGLFSHQKDGFYHDGRFATLLDVVNHHGGCMNLQLSDNDKSDLVKYLLTL
jgi:cytochrome c peroxidase